MRREMVFWFIACAHFKLRSQSGDLSFGLPISLETLCRQCLNWVGRCTESRTSWLRVFIALLTTSRLGIAVAALNG